MGSIAQTDVGAARRVAFISGGSRVGDLARRRSGRKGQPAGLVGRGSSASISAHQLVRLHRRADLHADRVLDRPCELDVGAVELAGALADPEQVGGDVVPVAEVESTRVIASS